MVVPGAMAITSSITDAAVDELGLKPGTRAFALIKPSDVMVGVCSDGQVRRAGLYG